MDGVLNEAVPPEDNTSVKVKRKTIKLKPVPTEIPENETEENAAETVEKQPKKKNLKLKKVDPDAEEVGPPNDDEVIKAPSKNLKKLGHKIKSDILNVKSNLKNHKAVKKILRSIYLIY